MPIDVIVIILIFTSIILELLYQVIKRAINHSKLTEELREVKELLKDIRMNQVLDCYKDK